MKHVRGSPQFCILFRMAGNKFGTKPIYVILTSLFSAAISNFGGFDFSESILCFTESKEKSRQFADLFLFRGHSSVRCYPVYCVFRRQQSTNHRKRAFLLAGLFGRHELFIVMMIFDSRQILRARTHF